MRMYAAEYCLLVVFTSLITMGKANDLQINALMILFNDIKCTKNNE
jgi:hypothetical protein